MIAQQGCNDSSLHENSSYVVIKYGGNAIGNDADLNRFGYNIAALLEHGLRPIVVHGGGPFISRMLAKLGIPSNFMHGYRVSTPEVVNVAAMVLSGHVAPILINALGNHGVSAIGLSGQDAKLYTVKKYQPSYQGQELDIGNVGQIFSVNTAIIDQLLTLGIIPVISCIGPDAQGALYNVNADNVAGAIAGAVTAKALIVLTNVAGIFRDWPNENSLIERIALSELYELVPDIDSGMLPKIRGCIDALEKGAQKAYIIPGNITSDYVSIVQSAAALGTVIVP